MSHIEAMKQALEALEYASTGNRRPEVIGAAITAIKQALAAPVQEPVAYQQRTRPNWKDETCWTPWEDCSKSEAEDCWNRPQIHDWLYEARALYTTPHAQPAPVQEQAEQLAKLGWQAIECPFCGSSGAQAFPKPAAQPVYDQESLELCNTCGWKTLIPEDGCLNCEREAAAFAKEQLESAYQRGYLDGIGRQCPQCADYRAMYLKVRDELAAEQQRGIQRPQPLTDEQISAMCKYTWVFETAKQWVRAIEAAHNIKGAA